MRRTSWTAVSACILTSIIVGTERELETKEKPQKLVTNREFLPIEEVKKVINTPCRYEIVKKAFLFSCFTGLRYNDMKALNWSEIHSAADDKTEYIDHIQIKTKDRVTILLSEEAKRWMPERIDSVDNIFLQLTITHITVEEEVGLFDGVF